MQRLFHIAAGAVAATFFCGAAHAQMFRAYLASYGADTNPCTVAAPCRLLPAALSAVSDGGEIWILDSANYNAGAVDIGKNVTILAVPGAVGSFVAVAGGPALTITTNVNVHLRNIVIANNAANPGTDGIQVGFGKLDIEGSVLSAAQAAIRITSGFLSVHDTVITNSTMGISAEGASYLDVSNTRFSYMGNTGIRMQGSTETVVQGNGSTFGTVSDSSFTEMNIGIALVAQPPATLSAAIAHITVSDAAYGVFLSCDGSNKASATVGRSTFAHVFTTALYQSGSCAVLESLGDNEAHGNGANTSGTITPASGF